MRQLTGCQGRISGVGLMFIVGIRLQKLLLWQQQLMGRTYYLCFSVNRIVVSPQVIESIDLLTLFSLQLRKGQRSIGHTQRFLCAANDRREVALQKVFIHLRVRNFNLGVKEVCQLRFNAYPDLCSQVELGEYEFLMNSYVRALEDYDLNCLQMSMSIGEHFLIDYSVFVEYTDEALKEIVYQHFSAVDLESEDEQLSEVNSMGECELGQTNLKHIQHSAEKGENRTESKKSGSKRSGSRDGKSSSPVQNKRFSRKSNVSPKKGLMLSTGSSFRGRQVLPDLDDFEQPSPSPKKVSVRKIKRSETLPLDLSLTETVPFARTTTGDQPQATLMKELNEEESEECEIDRMIRSESKITVSESPLKNSIRRQKGVKRTAPPQSAYRMGIGLLKSNYQILLGLLVLAVLVWESSLALDEQFFGRVAAKVAKKRAPRPARSPA